MHHPQQPPPYHLHQQQTPQFQQQQQQQPHHLHFRQQLDPQQQQEIHQMQYQQQPQQLQVQCQQQISPPAYHPMEQVVPLQHQHHSQHQLQHHRHQQQHQQSDMINMMQSDPIQFQPAGQHLQHQQLPQQQQPPQHHHQPQQQHHHHQQHHQAQQQQLHLHQQQRQHQLQHQHHQHQHHHSNMVDPYTKELSDILNETNCLEVTLKETRDIKEQIAIDLQQGVRACHWLKAHSEAPIEHPRDYTKVVKTKTDQEKMVRDNFEKLRVSSSQIFEAQTNLLRRVTKILEAIVYGHLPKWHRDQQLASNGQPPKPEGATGGGANANGAGVNSHNVLDIIQTWVERIIDIIWKLRMQLKFLYDIITLNETYIFDFDRLFILGQKLDKALEMLIMKSFVVDKQPPQVMKTNTRFTSSVRFLGGCRLNLTMISPTVKATILSEGNARAVIRRHRQMIDASWVELEMELEKQQQRQAGLLPPSPDPPYSFSQSPELCQPADAAAIASLHRQQQEQQAFFQQHQQFNPSAQSPPRSMAQQYSNQQQNVQTNSGSNSNNNIGRSTSNNPSPPALNSPYQQQPLSVASSTTTTTSTTNAAADIHSMMPTPTPPAYYHSGSPSGASVVTVATSPMVNAGTNNANFQHLQQQQQQQQANFSTSLLDTAQDKQSRYLQRVQQEKLRQRKLKEQQEPRLPPKIVNMNEFDPSGEILNNNNMLEYTEGTNQMICHFRNMQLKKIKRTEKKGTESVMDEKFVLLFHLEFRIAELSDPARSNSYWHKQEDLAFHIMAFSLPVVVIVHGNQEPHAWATVTWHNAFAKQSPDEPLYQVPDKVTWQELGQVLSEKFKTCAGKGLSSQNLSYLATKVGRGARSSTSSSHHHYQNGNSLGSITSATTSQQELGQDNKQIINNKHSNSNSSINNVSESNGNGSCSSNNNNMITWAQFSKETLPEKSFTFWEWFHSILKLTKEHLRDLWNDDRIFGFVGKKGCVDLLLGSSMYEPTPVGTFLLRYSETELGGITIAWVSNSSQTNKERSIQILQRQSPTNSSSNVLMHLQPFVSKDLNTRSLADRIRDLEDLVYLYPDIPKDEAFKSYYTPLNEITPSNGYVRPMLIQTLVTNYPKNLAASSMIDPSLTPATPNSNFSQSSPDAASYQDQAFLNEMDTTCSYPVYGSSTAPPSATTNQMNVIPSNNNQSNSIVVAGPAASGVINGTPINNSNDRHHHQQHHEPMAISDEYNHSIR